MTFFLNVKRMFRVDEAKTSTRTYLINYFELFGELLISQSVSKSCGVWNEGERERKNEPRLNPRVREKGRPLMSVPPSRCSTCRRRFPLRGISPDGTEWGIFTTRKKSRGRGRKREQGTIEGARKRGWWEWSILDNSRILLAGILGPCCTRTILFLFLFFNILVPIHTSCLVVSLLSFISPCLFYHFPLFLSYISSFTSFSLSFTDIPFLVPFSIGFLFCRTATFATLFLLFGIFHAVPATLQSRSVRVLFSFTLPSDHV